MKHGSRKAGKKETQQQIKRRLLAKRIAKALFTDGTGSRARRLVIELPSQNYLASGYCEGAVADLIERKLAKFILFSGGRK